MKQPQTTVPYLKPFTFVSTPSKCFVAEPLLLFVFILVCCTTLACRNRQESFVDSLREKFQDDEFTVSFREPLYDGRTVIAIDWASTKPYAKEPLRGYRLLVRRNGKPYYMRTFGSHEYNPGFAMDRALSRAEFEQNDTLSVGIEVNLDRYFKDSLILSNSLDIELPPEPAADLSVPPR